MTHDEMERSMVFVLDSQATLTAKLEKLTEDQAKLTTNVEQLTADIAEMKVQAGLDRAEMRDAINAMLLIAERMERNVIGLTKRKRERRNGWAGSKSE